MSALPGSEPSRVASALRTPLLTLQTHLEPLPTLLLHLLFFLLLALPPCKHLFTQTPIEGLREACFPQDYPDFGSPLKSLKLEKTLLLPLDISLA